MELDKRDEAEEHKTYELVREAECKLAQIIVQARVPFAKSAYTKTNTWVRKLKRTGASEICHLNLIKLFL